MNEKRRQPAFAPTKEEKAEIRGVTSRNMPRNIRGVTNIDLFWNLNLDSDLGNGPTWPLSRASPRNLALIFEAYAGTYRS